MSRLAPRWGLSGNGLAKICDRMGVPYPPRGHWAKKAAGKEVEALSLPPAEKGNLATVTFGRSQSHAAAPKPPVEVKAKVEAARAATSSVAVPERLVRPHPVIAGWLARYEQRKREARLERDPFRKKLIDPREFTAADRRQHRILDVLFKALEKQGGKVGESQRDLWVELQGEKIEFQLREKHKQTRRPLNKREKQWASEGDKGWRQELQPTGQLTLTIKTYLTQGLRREWNESNHTSMEALLPEIVATFVAAGPLLVEQRRKREEAERERQIAERKRYEEEQRRKLDDNRWRRFVDFARQRRDVEVAQAFLDAIRSAAFDAQQDVGGSSIADWIAWAEQRVIDADPIAKGVDGVFRSLAQVTAWTYRD